MLIFMKMVYSQSDETSISDVVEILKPFKEKKKFFLWILHFGGDFTVTFLRKQQKLKIP